MLKLRQISALLLAVVLAAACFAGCDTNKKLTWKISDNLPVIEIDGSYSPFDVEPGEGYETVGAYQTKNTKADVRAIIVYQWADDGNSLLEDAEQDIEMFYPDQEITPIEWNAFYEDGDYTYSYYCAFETDFFDTPTYVQSYIFRDGDKKVQYCYLCNTQKVALDDGVSMYLPIRMTKCKLSDTQAADHAVFQYKDLTSILEFPDVVYYNWEATGEGLDAAAKEYEETYNASEIGFYDFTADDGVTYPALYAVMETTDGGVTYSDIEYATRIGDRYTSLDFLVAKDDPTIDYIFASIPAMLWSITK